MTTSPTSGPVSRRAALAGLGAGSLGLALATTGLAGSAQDATPAAGDAKAAALRLYENVFNQKDFDVLEDIFADDVVDHTGGPSGGEAAKGVVRAVIDAFPDIHVTPEVWVVEGDLVAAYVTWTGTHQGDFLGVPASGRETNWSHIDIVRIRDGKHAEIWHPGLVTALQLALGFELVPPSGAATPVP